MHVFDYNLDYFEVGALDDPQFKIADPKVRIVERAAAAPGGLWGNHAYEAVYIMTYVDDHGEQLNGDRTYTLRLDPPAAGRRRSGPSRCTTCRTSTSSPTRSTATPSATAPRASSTPTTDR